MSASSAVSPTLSTPRYTSSRRFSPARRHLLVLRSSAARCGGLSRLALSPHRSARRHSFLQRRLGKSYSVNADSTADAIVAQATGTMDFPRLIEQAWDDGVRVFIEIAPGNSCTRMIEAILGDRPFVARALCTRKADDMTSLLQTLATLIVEGVPVDLQRLYNGRVAR
ncbi:MAG: hypothetical protein R3C68_05035 [Myxococcota bacterium]